MAKVNLPYEGEQEEELDASSLEKFRLYETRSRLYLIGSDIDRRFFRVLKIDRSEPSELNISEDPVVYSQQETKSLLQRIGEGNRSTGGLNFVAKVYGIAGCIRFLESYYLIVITKRRQIGSVCGRAIYGIEESQMITIPHSTVQSDVANSKTELRYKKLLSSVDLTKDFFYSYTYPIMRSLQKNVQAVGEESMPYDNIFVWNTFLTQPIRSRCNNPHWTVALVHGYFNQVRLSIFGREFSIVLISRRSRHFAGTRYLKRGVNDRGCVANDVETEQIVLDEEAGTYKGRMTSFIQMRGSIPLFWSQEASRLSPKPDIIVQRYDPTYEATKLHFEDLVKRYGNPIIVLNLIKTVEKRPREMMLRREFAHAVGYLNQILPEDKRLKFIHWDFHKFAKSKSANVLGVLSVVASEALDLTGFYLSGKQTSLKRRSTQLSRTSIGRETSLSDLRGISSDFSKVFPERQGKWKATTQSREFLKSIKRYYSNTYTDGEKQDAMNLFLGYFQPQEGKPALWELDSDYYLHVYGIGDEPLSETTSSHGDITFDGVGQTLTPAPACKRDFHRMKLTVFDKLIEATCGSIKNVRLSAEPSFRSSGTVGNFGMAADAAEIQLKTPNWLFGQKKDGDSGSNATVAAPKSETSQSKFTINFKEFLDLEFLSSTEITDEEASERYQQTVFPVDDIKWYGGRLLYSKDETSEAYKHYSEICQGTAMNHFSCDIEQEQHYLHALNMELENYDDMRTEEQMEAALDEYCLAGTNLGVLPSCKDIPVDDPSQLTRWLIGYDKLPGQVAEL
ncbi:phosphoinositide phosphatase family protein isoform X2 [Wolffia australiana]